MFKDELNIITEKAMHRVKLPEYGKVTLTIHKNKVVKVMTCEDELFNHKNTKEEKKK